MNPRVWRIPALLCAAALAAGAQPGHIGAPVAGYVFDGAALAVRPVLGIPGAAVFGDPLALGFGLASAFVAPGQDSAFVTAADGTLHLFRLDSGAASEQTCYGLPQAPGRVVFSPSGTAAALYASASAAVVTGLPGSPSLAWTADLSAAGAPGSLAVSDDGTLLLAAAGGSLWLANATGGALRLADAGAGAGALVAFAPKGHGAAVADASGAGLSIYRDVTGAAAPAVLVGTGDALGTPVGLAFSADGGRLYVASSTGAAVGSFNASTGERADIVCGCTPTGLSPMGNFFRLTDAGSAQLWLLDAASGEPRIVFVPSAPSTALSE